jgi:hypothetical protein
MSIGFQAAQDGIPTITKDPADKTFYTIDWNAPAAKGGPWLVSGETILTTGPNVPVWTVDPGLTHDIGLDSATGTSTAIWVEGGSLRGKYLVTCTVNTTLGRVGKKSFRVILQQK